MKKKIILFAAGAVLLAASAFTFASVNKSNDPMDDLFKANVEALARNEGGVKQCYVANRYGIKAYGIYCHEKTQDPLIYPCIDPYNDRHGGFSYCYY